jgi:hypothetical protein
VGTALESYEELHSYVVETITEAVGEAYAVASTYVETLQTATGSQSSPGDDFAHG